MWIALQILLVVTAVALTGYYAGIETGIISLRRVRLEHLRRMGDRRARLVGHFLEHTDRLFGTTLVGTNLCTVAASVVAASLMVNWIGRWGAGISSVVMTVVILVFGEYLPKAWFRVRPTERSLRLVGFLSSSEKLLYPVGRLLTALIKLVMPLARHRDAFSHPFIRRDELRLLALESEVSGRITRREREIIDAILELPSRRVAEAMTPAQRMVTIPVDAPAGEAVELARRSGYMRLVVVSADGTRVVGVVNVLDVIRLEGERGPLAEFLGPAYFVGPEAPLTEVLQQMRMLREPLLLVGSEGDCRGLITTEDILRLVVGESSAAA